jgi:hypothetical protein
MRALGSPESPLLVIGAFVALRMSRGFCCVWLERSRRKTLIAMKQEERKILLALKRERRNRPS